VDLQTRRLAGFEALARWRHPCRGLVMPDAFIPTAEETGLIRPLGMWVLREACRQMQHWHTQFPHQPPLGVAVNLSTCQLADADLAMGRLFFQEAGEVVDAHLPAGRAVGALRGAEDRVEALDREAHLAFGLKKFPGAKTP